MKLGHHYIAQFKFWEVIFLHLRMACFDRGAVTDIHRSISRLCERRSEREQEPFPCLVVSVEPTSFNSRNGIIQINLPIKALFLTSFACMAAPSDVTKLPIHFLFASVKLPWEAQSPTLHTVNHLSTLQGFRGVCCCQSLVRLDPGQTIFFRCVRPSSYLLFL